MVEDDAEEEEDGEIALSLGGLSLLDSFVPSQNNVEVRVVVYDLETTGLGATDKISIMELGQKLQFSAVSLLKSTHAPLVCRSRCGCLYHKRLGTG